MPEPHVHLNESQQNKLWENILLHSFKIQAQHPCDGGPEFESACRNLYRTTGRTLPELWEATRDEVKAINAVMGETWNA